MVERKGANVTQICESGKKKGLCLRTETEQRRLSVELTLNVDSPLSHLGDLDV